MFFASSWVVKRGEGLGVPSAESAARFLGDIARAPRIDSAGPRQQSAAAAAGSAAGAGSSAAGGGSRSRGKRAAKRCGGCGATKGENGAALKVRSWVGCGAGRCR